MQGLRESTGVRECGTVCAALRGRAEEGSEGEGEGGGLGLGWPQHQASRCAVLLREPTARGAAKPRARRSTGCARKCVGEGDQVLGLGPGVCVKPHGGDVT